MYDSRNATDIDGIDLYNDLNVILNSLMIFIQHFRECGYKTINNRFRRSERKTS